MIYLCCRLKRVSLDVNEKGELQSFNTRTPKSATKGRSIQGEVLFECIALRLNLFCPKVNYRDKCSHVILTCVVGGSNPAAL